MGEGSFFLFFCYQFALIVAAYYDCFFPSSTCFGVVVENDFMSPLFDSICAV